MMSSLNTDQTENKDFTEYEITSPEGTDILVIIDEYKDSDGVKHTIGSEYVEETFYCYSITIDTPTSTKERKQQKMYFEYKKGSNKIKVVNYFPNEGNQLAQSNILFFLKKIPDLTVV